ncbi:phosphotriesterase family protein [Clostridium gasigenes]|uniref:Phosphotriesterase n=1 Tax=Clostridium gasigenes TaxID=94869 RepID=A0A7X0VQP7_9CLOT|nr:phosphotriesterase [Clostridium gasigenes]MBB6714509.1 phosphotriesterase [Clostridium gasigenes]
MIQTVCGLIDKKELGITLAHEHIIIDLSLIRNEQDSVLDNCKTMINEISYGKKLGLQSIVEVTNEGMGRNHLKLKYISEKAKVNIVASTGFYMEKYYDNKALDNAEEKIAEIMIKELTFGIDDTNIRAGIIGEIGSSLNTITELEKKVFNACIIASEKTGAAITTHCDLGTMGLEQAMLFSRSGINLDKVIIGHSDLNRDYKVIEKILSSGVNVAFDTISKNSYLDDDVRLYNLLKLLEMGYEDKIVLSQDLTRKSHLKINNGTGYTAVLGGFISKLKINGVDSKILSKLIGGNIARVIDKN